MSCARSTFMEKRKKEVKRKYKTGDEDAVTSENYCLACSIVSFVYFPRLWLKTNRFAERPLNKRTHTLFDEKHRFPMGVTTLLIYCWNAYNENWFCQTKKSKKKKQRKKLQNVNWKGWERKTIENHFLTNSNRTLFPRRKLESNWNAWWNFYGYNANITTVVNRFNIV